MNEAVLQGAAVGSIAMQMSQLKDILADSANAAGPLAEVKAEVAAMYKDYNEPTDRKLMEAMIAMVMADIPKEMQAPIFDTIRIKWNGNVKAFVDEAEDGVSLKHECVVVQGFVAKLVYQIALVAQMGCRATDECDDSGSREYNVCECVAHRIC